MATIDSLHLVVSDLSAAREHYVERLGFRQAGLSGAAFEREHEARASLLESGEARVVLLSPLTGSSAYARRLQEHGPGIARIVLAVNDLARWQQQLAAAGGLVCSLGESRGQSSYVGFDLTVPNLPVTLRFVQSQDAQLVWPGLVCRAPRKTCFGRLGIGRLDHLTLAVGGLESAVLTLQQLGFSRYYGVELQELRGVANSVVMWQPELGLKLQLVDDRKLRHEIAFRVADVAATLRSLGDQGYTPLPRSSEYYRRLPEELLILGIDAIEEEMATLSSLQLTVRAAAQRSYQLHALLPAAADCPTVRLIEQKLEPLSSREDAA